MMCFVGYRRIFITAPVLYTILPRPPGECNRKFKKVTCYTGGCVFYSIAKMDALGCAPTVWLAILPSLITMRAGML